MWSITGLQRSRKSFSNMKHGGVAILSWALHADKQIISSSFWSQLNMENNLCTHTKKETVSKGMLWKLWEVEVRLAVSEALIHSSWMCGIADVVRDLTLGAWQTSHLLALWWGLSCLCCMLEAQKPHVPNIWGEESCPHFVNSFFNTSQTMQAWVLPSFLSPSVFHRDLAATGQSVPQLQMSPAFPCPWQCPRLFPSSSHQRKSLFPGAVKWLTQDQTVGQ